MEIQHIGRYEIIGKLGSGGMATVLLGKDSFMDREVAIKLLPRLFMHDPTFKERFQREAKLLAQLEHSAIVPVYDFGYHEDQPYMVNRYMRGGSLLERITEQGALPLDVSLTIVSRICSALSAAHKRGIVHRDIKPANILFDDSGQAFIADFGIAKLAESTSTLTGNTLVGTPAYMSPEQFSGEHEIDGRSDQYSLAIVLFEMLSGEVPFKGDTTAKLMKNHLMDDPPSLRTLCSDLPESVEPVVEKALQKKPADRFPTIEAFQKSLAEAVKGEPWMSEAAPAFLPTSKPAEVYQTNAVAEDEKQELPPKLIREDVYATNILQERPLDGDSEETEIEEDAERKKQPAKGEKLPKSKISTSSITAWFLMILGWGLGGWCAHLVRMRLRYEFMINEALHRNTVVVGALIVCFLGSLFMVLAFRMKSKKTKFSLALLLIGGWIISGLLMGLDAVLSQIYFGIGYWHFIGFLMGGLITGLILKRIESGLNWKHVALIALSWSIGSLPGNFVGGLGSAITRVEGSTAYFESIPQTHNLWSGLLLGVICGGLTLLILKRAQLSKKALDHS